MLDKGNIGLDFKSYLEEYSCCFTERVSDYLTHYWNDYSAENYTGSYFWLTKFLESFLKSILDHYSVRYQSKAQADDLIKAVGRMDNEKGTDISKEETALLRKMADVCRVISQFRNKEHDDNISPVNEQRIKDDCMIINNQLCELFSYYIQTQVAEKNESENRQNDYDLAVNNDEEEIKEDKYQIARLLNPNFDKSSVPLTDPIDIEELNKVRKYLEETEASNYMDEFFGSLFQEMDNDDMQFDCKESNDERSNDLFDNTADLTPTEKYFELPERDGENITVFLVKRNVQFAWGIYSYQLVYLEKLREQGYRINRSAFFTNEHPEKDGNPLVIIHFTKNNVFINMGFISRSKIILSKCPLPFRLQNVKEISDDPERWFSQILNEFDEIKYYNDYIIIDQETGLPVKKEFAFIEGTNSVVEQVKIRSNTNYSASAIISQKGIINLDNLELGKFYKTRNTNKGEDLARALILLKRDKSPEAYYEIADIFSSKKYHNEEQYYLYINKAIKKHYFPAVVDWTVHCVLNKESFDLMHVIKEFTDDAYREEKAFLIAYYEEKMQGIMNGSLYSESAKLGFLPAARRLGYNCCEKINDVGISGYYPVDESKADYCMGAALLFGYSDMPKKQEYGMKLLETAAVKGNLEAIKTLYKVYKGDFVEITNKYNNEKIKYSHNEEMAQYWLNRFYYEVEKKKTD